MSVLNIISEYTSYSPKDIRIMTEKHNLLPDEIRFLIENTPSTDINYILLMVGKSKTKMLTDMGAITISDNTLKFDISQLMK